ncbi:HIT family protein [Caulobacter sp. 17J80-11]|uniref:HIT family protein n=1 Tax=Caulobacter sp. 17J80-11 TaxID=2763502 RepID=UPI0016534DC2|nr:HIT family protein [Caulobacter sp. 17J80-11]MBC6982011.1 HIT family protein [Caulobacter sp. 17J80-11]
MSLNGAYDRDNVFAKILRGEMPATKVYEDDQVLAIMDVFPQSRGHTLVLPKVEARNLLDIEPDALQGLITRVQKVARAVEKALDPDGVTVMQFNGAAGGQTVFHLHFHIVPRWDGKAMGRHAEGMADQAELAELAKQISAAMRG